MEVEAEMNRFPFAVGFSGMGINLGLPTDQIIADFILDGAPSPYSESLSYRRFLGKRAST